MKKETKSGDIIFIPHDSSPIIQERGGFTLLEVLISLAIIGGLLVTLICTLNYHLGLVEKQEIVTTATLLAKNKMYATEKSPAESKGAFDSPYEQYSYETFLKDSPYPGIAEVIVAVKSGHEEVRLNEFVFK